MKNLRARGSGSVYRLGNSKFWWLSYSINGKRYAESSESVRKQDAILLLNQRLGDAGRGLPVTPKVGRVWFEEAAEDMLNDYRVNGKKSLDVVERRINKHLRPFFAGRRMASITTADVRTYVVHRQSTDTVLVKKAQGDEPEIRRPASNAEINRELAHLKRMFVLAVQGSKLLHRPHIPMLREDNVRTGFFEADQLLSVLAHLPSAIRPVIEYASITGWRIASEVLPLQWRQVDFRASEVRLDAGTTKNREGRVFPMTADLRRALEAQREERERLKKAGHIVPHVFFREVAKGRGGPLEPRPITTFSKAWKAACVAAGCPGRIPHDLRRTAARNFVRAGIPERVAMMLTGHRTRSVFDRYNIVSGGDLREAAGKLDAAGVIRRGQSNPRTVRAASN